MSLIPLWAKFAGGGMIALALVLAGWVVKGKFERAAEADALDHRLKAVIAAHAESEAARIKLSADLAKATGTIHTQIKEVIRRVPQLVRDDRACDFSGELTGVLNRARGYDVPSPGRPATSPTPKPTAPP